MLYVDNRVSARRRGYAWRAAVARRERCQEKVVRIGDECALQIGRDWYRNAAFGYHHVEDVARRCCAGRRRRWEGRRLSQLDEPAIDVTNQDGTRAVCECDRLGPGVAIVALACLTRASVVSRSR